MFTGILFAVFQNLKLSKSPSIVERINKLWHINTIGSNTTMTVTMTTLKLHRINFTKIMLNEVSQNQKIHMLYDSIYLKTE
jgi:hypothetical protein